MFWLFSLNIFMSVAESYSEPCQTSKMKCFPKRVNGQKPLSIFTKHSILDAWQGSAYDSVLGSNKSKKNHPFSMYAKCFEKLTFLTPLICTRRCVIRGKCYFFEKYCVRNKWIIPDNIMFVKRSCEKPI